MEDSRLRIVNLLQQHNQVTIEQLSRHLGLAPATVRRHLDILQRDQLVAFQQVKKKTGRPEHTYYLTETGQDAQPKHYDHLLGRLIQELSTLSLSEGSDHTGEQLLLVLLQRIAQKTAATVDRKGQDSFAQRLGEAVKVLNQEEFQVEVKEGKGSIHILLHNCPFRRVAMNNGCVCSYDRLVLSTILGTEVSMEQCIRKGDGDCCYIASTSSDSK